MNKMGMEWEKERKKSHKESREKSKAYDVVKNKGQVHDRVETMTPTVEIERVPRRSHRLKLETCVGSEGKIKKNKSRRGREKKEKRGEKSDETKSV